MCLICLVWQVGRNMLITWTSLCADGKSICRVCTGGRWNGWAFPVVNAQLRSLLLLASNSSCPTGHSLSENPPGLSIRTNFSTVTHFGLSKVQCYFLDVISLNLRFFSSCLKFWGVIFSFLVYRCKYFFSPFASWTFVTFPYVDRGWTSFWIRRGLQCKFQNVQQALSLWKM